MSGRRFFSYIVITRVIFFAFFSQLIFGSLDFNRTSVPTGEESRQMNELQKHMNIKVKLFTFFMDCFTKSDQVFFFCPFFRRNISC